MNVLLFSALLHFINFTVNFPIAEPKLKCDIHGALAQAKESLLQEKTQKHEHGEGGKRSVPLRLLNINTCKQKTITIDRFASNGSHVTGDREVILTLELEDKFRGWNGWNTAFKVHPDEWVVIGMLWTRHSDSGEHENVIYAPYSTSLEHNFPELADMGRIHYERDLSEAYELLRNLGVPSAARENTLAADLAEDLFSEEIRLIHLLEHVDPDEFTEFKKNPEMARVDPFRRVQVIIGANGNSAYHPTRSKAGALGIVQIWPPTCRDLRKAYKEALLPRDCLGSSKDNPHGHIESIKGTILHFDYRLANFINELDLSHNATSKLFSFPNGEIIAKKELRRMLVGAYNGGPGYWHMKRGRIGGQGISFEIYTHKIRGKSPDKRWDSYANHPPARKTRNGWTNGNRVRTETMQYLEKYDFLIKNREKLGITKLENKPLAN